MRWLLFLSRLAFICGLFFLLSFTLLVKDWTGDQAITSTIILIGHMLGLVFIPIVNVCYLGVLFIKRDLRPYVPTWLVVGNVFLLVILGLYIYMHYGERFAAA
ncbi:MAG: hypothetical protein EOO09_09060 [Chitinophagaceae bacterium]|nr:MAG: hypothetical protein EOO09_09060 [Chitinophagaceae bacterium]